MSNDIIHAIRTLTEVTYPNGYPKWDKWDYFVIHDEELPDKFRHGGYNLDEFYDFLNNNGYWVKGWQEIEDEHELWLDNHPELHGEQTEVVVEVSNAG